jgi:hypothetical protein
MTQYCTYCSDAFEEGKVPVEVEGELYHEDCLDASLEEEEADDEASE